MIDSIRSERAGDIESIERLTLHAFADEPHSDQCELFIIRALRKQQALTVSLVAELQAQVVGHVAVSPVRINAAYQAWYGLGPISVAPEHQRQGIGSALMHAALQALEAMGAHGCVLLGDPNFYQRFGFAACPALVLPNVPPEYFQALRFRGEWPQGVVTYHEAFDAKC